MSSRTSPTPPVDVWDFNGGPAEGVFTKGERVFVPVMSCEGVFVRKAPWAWIVRIEDKERGYRNIAHLPILDRMADL